MAAADFMDQVLVQGYARRREEMTRGGEEMRGDKVRCWKRGGEEGEKKREGREKRAGSKARQEKNY